MLIWLQNHLLICPFKYFTGLDCPGCGFQRSVIALLHGNVKQSFIVYPPAIPILLLITYYFGTTFLKANESKSNLLKPFLLVVGAFVMANYGYKIWNYIV